jgi:hypothetical protein
MINAQLMSMGCRSSCLVRDLNELEGGAISVSVAPLAMSSAVTSVVSAMMAAMGESMSAVMATVASEALCVEQEQVIQRKTG